MKYIQTLFLIIFTSFTYGQSFKVTNDTLNISLSHLIKPAFKTGLTHLIKFKKKYYCFFNEIKRDNNRRSLKFCFVIAEDGNVLRKIDVPNEIQNAYYYDLFLKNDSIFVKTYMNSKTFFFNPDKLEWLNTKDADDMIFEDERFYFNYLDFEEWGNTTWCKDKLSGKEYELSSSGTIINKIDSAYYITSSLKVLKIENPLKLKECESAYYYEIVRKKDRSEGSNSLSGAEVLFEDSTYSYWEQRKPKFIIATSFVMDNKLYHLCMDSTKTFIAKIESGQMIPTQIIDSTISTFNWHYSYRNKVQNDNSQLLKFKAKDQFGLIEINGQAINVHYINLK